MTIAEISNKITALFNGMKKPAQKVPGMLVATGGIMRPGASATISVSNIVQKLNDAGIPTGAMPDGTDNKVVQLVIAIVEEIFRALREDSNIQVSFTPGQISVLTFGSNSAGPVVSEGVNINFPEGQAVIQ